MRSKKYEGRRNDEKLKIENGKLKIRPDGIRRNHQEEPASDAGERKKEKLRGGLPRSF